VLLLATGSDLTPARVIAEAVVTDQPGRPVTLLLPAATRQRDRPKMPGRLGAPTSDSASAHPHRWRVVTAPRPDPGPTARPVRHAARCRGLHRRSTRLRHRLRRHRTDPLRRPDTGTHRAVLRRATALAGTAAHRSRARDALGTRERKPPPHVSIFSDPTSGKVYQRIVADVDSGVATRLILIEPAGPS
jgi:hypothetical protein